MAMADESQKSDSEEKLNFIEIILCDLCEALMDSSNSEKYLTARLNRISPEAKEEYLNIKRDFLKPTKPKPKAKGICQHFRPSPPSTSSRKSMVSRLLRLAKSIMSQYSICNSNSTINDFKVIHLVISNVLEALLTADDGTTSYYYCLQRFCQSSYFDREGGATNTNAKSNARIVDQYYDRGTTKALPENIKAWFINSWGNTTRFLWDDLMTVKVEELFMPRKSIVDEFINSRGNNINVADLVSGFVWDRLIYKPQGEEHFLSRLKRISREAIKEYLNLTAVYTSETEVVDTQDCDPAMATSQKASTQEAASSEPSSSTAKKSSAKKFAKAATFGQFGDICESIRPRAVLPGGLALAQSIFCAKAALSFFNSKHGTNYKLIEPLASAQYMVWGVRFHSNFIAAKAEKNASPKLFYANFRCFEQRVRDVHCCIIDLKKAKFACCRDCPLILAHCKKHHDIEDLVGYHCNYLPKESKAKKDEFCAKAALDLYNENHGTEYGLVESLDSYIVPINLATYRFSCRFKAKLHANANDDDDDDEDDDEDEDDDASKLFAAEMVMSSSWKDGHCYIINSAERSDQ